MDREGYNKLFPEKVFRKIEQNDKKLYIDEKISRKRTRVKNAFSVTLKTIALLVVITASSMYIWINKQTLTDLMLSLQQSVGNIQITEKIPKINISVEKRTDTGPVADANLLSAQVKELSVQWKDYIHPSLNFAFKYPLPESKPPSHVLNQGQPQIATFYYAIPFAADSSKILRGWVEVDSFTQSSCNAVLQAIGSRQNTTEVTINGRIYRKGQGDVLGKGVPTLQFFYITQIPERQSACVAVVATAKVTNPNTYSQTDREIHERLIETMISTFQL